METGHYTTLFPLACAGFGLLLAGGANLLLLRRGFVVRALATVAGLAAGVGAAESLNQPGATEWTVKILAAAMGVCLVLGWGGLVERVARVVAALATPAVRFGLVTACGIGTITAGAAYFQWADEKALDASALDLELIHSRVPSVPSASKAATDQGSAILLREATPREGIDFVAIEDQFLRNNRLDGQVIRRGPGSDSSNCHGWVFAGGRFHLGPDEVELVLKENGYQEVHQPQPGDVVIYRAGGVISHTALTRYVTEGQPVLVEGKWGTLGVFLHPADKSPYGTEYAFYRSGRTGHVVAGLGGPTDTNSATVPMSTE